MLTARRLALAIAVVAACLTETVTASSVALADPPIVVTPGGGHGSGTVGIAVHGPGGADHPGDGNSKATGPAIDPCIVNPASAACQASVKAAMCSGFAADWASGTKTPSLNGLTPAQLASLNRNLTANGCPALSAATAPPTAAQLAQSAYGQLTLPSPLPSRYPTGTLADGRKFTIVQSEMWFWSDPATWTPLSKTVCAGALCATATAKPATLTFDPGNGDQAVTCPGPGTAWTRPAGGSWVPTRQPQGCDYRYTRSTYGQPNGELTAAYTITWTVSWTGTNGTAGTQNPLMTTATSTFAVAELQTVVTQ